MKGPFRPSPVHPACSSNAFSNHIVERVPSQIVNWTAPASSFIDVWPAATVTEQLNTSCFGGESWSVTLGRQKTVQCQLASHPRRFAMLSLPPLADRPPEQMDDPTLNEVEHRRALVALARINWISQTATQLTRRIVRLLDDGSAPTGGRVVRIIDIACGGGDLTAAVARQLGARLAGPVEVIGIDISDRAVGWARQQHAGRSGSASLQFRQADALGTGCPDCDVAIHSLFLHHLNDTEAIRLLRTMGTAAEAGGVFSDLLRSRLGLLLARLGTTFLARSRVARVDGPLSVKAARTTEEYRQLLTAAGLPPAKIDRTWPERVCVSWGRPA